VRTFGPFSAGQTGQIEVEHEQTAPIMRFGMATSVTDLAHGKPQLLNVHLT
jgi:hypothetical protein